MNTHDVDSALARLRNTRPHTVGELSPPMVLCTGMMPPVDWQLASIESAVHGTLPTEMKLLWTKASEFRLQCDATYRQWGCLLWSPSDVLRRHDESLAWRGHEEFRFGDLIIGAFQGDSDLVVLRCDPTTFDFGGVLIALAMDGRDQWQKVASSVSDFIVNFLTHPENKFWESPA